MQLSEYEYSAILACLIVLCLVVLSLSVIFSNFDLESSKEKSLEQRAVLFGKQIILSKGIRDNYQLSDVSCPGSTWYYLTYIYDNIEIKMEVIYWENENKFTFKEGSFSQVPI